MVANAEKHLRLGRIIRQTLMIINDDNSCLAPLGSTLVWQIVAKMKPLNIFFHMESSRAKRTAALHFGTTLWHYTTIGKAHAFICKVSKTKSFQYDCWKGSTRLPSCYKIRWLYLKAINKNLLYDLQISSLNCISLLKMALNNHQDSIFRQLIDLNRSIKS